MHDAHHISFTQKKSGGMRITSNMICTENNIDEPSIRNIALQSPKGYKCLICLSEGKSNCCFRNSTFSKHLKAKHQIRLTDMKDAILEDMSVTPELGFVCPKCNYFSLNRANYKRHCLKTCNCTPDLTRQNVELFITGHLCRITGPSKKYGDPRPNEKVSLASKELLKPGTKKSDIFEEIPYSSPIHETEDDAKVMSFQYHHQKINGMLFKYSVVFVLFLFVMVFTVMECFFVGQSNTEGGIPVGDQSKYRMAFLIVFSSWLIILIFQY